MRRNSNFFHKIILFVFFFTCVVATVFAGDTNKSSEAYLSFDDLCGGDGCCPNEGCIYTKALDCAFASVNGGKPVLIGCNRSAPGFQHTKISASVLGLKPKPFCNHIVISVNCAGGNVCPAAPKVPNYPGNSKEGYMNNPYWTGNIIATTSAPNALLSHYWKDGPGVYRIGVKDSAGSPYWENLYFKIDAGGAYNYTIDNLGFDCN